jgi:hypothetical protein
VHTECASPETHLKANVSRRLKRAVAMKTAFAFADPSGSTPRHAQCDA